MQNDEWLDSLYARMDAATEELAAAQARDATGKIDSRALLCAINNVVVPLTQIACLLMSDRERAKRIAVPDMLPKSGSDDDAAS